MKKIRITSVSFGRTINMGNYESARVDMTAEVGVGQSHEFALLHLHDEVANIERRLKFGQLKPMSCTRCGK